MNVLVCVFAPRSIRVSDVLYLSNLTVHSSVPVSEDSQMQLASLPSSRSIVVTSTNYTQLLTADHMVKTGHPYLLQLVQLSQEVDHVELGSYPSLYRWSLNFNLYRALFGEAITPLREVASIQTMLRFQQMRAVLLQAFIAQIIIHPAGLRAIQDGIMDQQHFEAAQKRLQPIMRSIKQEEQQAAEEVAMAAAAAPSAAAGGKKIRGRTVTISVPAAPTAIVAAAGGGVAAPAAPVAVPSAQLSTVSSRVRRSTRTQTVASDHMAEQDATTAGRRGRSKVAAAAAGARAASESRVEGAAAAPATPARGHRRSLSATLRAMTPSRQKGKLVKMVIRKRKARPATEAEEGEGAAAVAIVAPVAALAAIPSPAASPSPSLAAATAAVSRSHLPSSPSTLATILLRDLNGEFELSVELGDPVLGHVNFDKGLDSISSTCTTPSEAPRVSFFLHASSPNMPQPLGSRMRCICLQSLPHTRSFMCFVFSVRVFVPRSSKACLISSLPPLSLLRNGMRSLSEPVEWL